MPASYEVPGKRIAFKAAADLSAKRYCAVTLNANGELILASAGSAMVGVLQLPVNTGEVSPVMTDGVSFGVVGADLTPGQDVEVDAAGKFIPLATGIKVGTCLVGGAAGVLGSILIK